MLSQSEIAARLKTPLPITVEEELDSTNLAARRVAESGDLAARAILARRQSHGRGRLGRSFFSPDGGIYLSLLLKPTLPPSDAIMLTTAAAVATSRAIDTLTERVCGIKWVNDLYLDNRKVCGILTEAKLDGDRLAYAIVGIGVNLTAPEDGFPEDIAWRAGALYPCGKAPSNAENILASGIINEFMRLYEQPKSSYLDEYRSRSIVIGREIDVIHVIGGESKRATAVAIDDECRLVVRYPDGSVEALGSGEISLKL